ncbi:MAG: DUF47 family protein [Erysipelothrix sp.]|nr:DUF47 family protein [Erysipelothrix sp.]
MFKKKNGYDYFASFHEFSAYAIEAADYLSVILNDFDVDKLEEQLSEMNSIETRSDIHHHAVNAQLLSEFLPVISAEDILKLNDLLDDIVDAIEDVLFGIYTFNVMNIRSQAVLFSDIIVKLAQALHEAMGEFKNYKKSDSIQKKLDVVKQLEKDADLLYLSELRRLHVDEENTRKLVMWTRIYDLFEDCADSFEEVIKHMEVIILKNT